MAKIAPINGWLLDRAVEIDTDVPGFVGHLLRSSIERRQVLAAYLSRDRSADGRSGTREVGDFLTTAGHGMILVAAFGSSPPGFRRALARSGPEAHAPRYYGYLHGLMSSASRANSASVVTRLSNIDPVRLRILRSLPTDLRAPNFIEAVERVEDAKDMAKLIALLAGKGVNRAAMSEALAKISSRERMAEFAKRWSMKAVLPDHPVPADASYRPVRHADELRKIATRYRNCARSYVANVLEGRSAFAEFIHDDGPAVVHLIRRSDIWSLERCYGDRNGQVRRAVVDAARAYLRRHGVRSRPRYAERSGEWEPLRRLIGHFEYDDD